MRSCSRSKTNRGALQCGRHIQQDSSLVILMSASLVFTVVRLHLWCGPQSTGRYSDTLHNDHSFCYLFLKFCLKPVFITSPVGSCKYPSPAKSVGSGGLESKKFCIQLHQSANKSIMVCCLALKHIFKDKWAFIQGHIYMQLNLAKPYC